MSIKVKCQMSKNNKVNFDGAYLRSSSGHFYICVEMSITEIQIPMERPTNVLGCNPTKVSGTWYCMAIRYLTPETILTAKQPIPAMGPGGDEAKVGAA